MPRSLAANSCGNLDKRALATESNLIGNRLIPRAINKIKTVVPITASMARLMLGSDQNR